jgi:hypothetical protein
MAQKKYLVTIALLRHEDFFKKYYADRWQAYADHWGFEFRPFYSWPLETNKHKSLMWIKELAVLEVMKEAAEGDIIAFIDADVFPIRGDLELTTEKSLRFVDDGRGNFNFGVFIVKNNEWARSLIQRIYDRNDCDDHGWQDNQALILERKAIFQKPQGDAEWYYHVEQLPWTMNATPPHSPPPAEIRFKHFAGDNQKWSDRVHEIMREQPLLFVSPNESPPPPPPSKPSAMQSEQERRDFGQRTGTEPPIVYGRSSCCDVPRPPRPASDVIREIRRMERRKKQR